MPIRKKMNGFSRSIQEHRERLSVARPSAAPLTVPRKDMLIPLRKTVSLPIHIYRPKHATRPYPTIFYVPGTAFVAREIAFTDVICTYIAEKAQCQVIIINHRLAPEHPFPKGLVDAYQLLRLMVNAPEKLFQIIKQK